MGRNYSVFLADLNYDNRLNHHNRHLPKNIGYVASYARKLYGADVDFRLFKETDRLLAALEDERPDLLGMSFYRWNTALSHTVAGMVRERWGKAVTIVWGGPSVDVDLEEQKRLFARFPEVDAFVWNEGELGFAALLGRLLAGTGDPWAEPIDGVVFRRDGELVRGREVGLTLDLAELPSPYLNGLMDPFVETALLPGLQTSRLCPYTCAFCVSGKSRGKLRAFPMDQVKADVEYIAKRYADRPYMELHINDENFGIIARDGEIAEFIVRCKEKYGYPQTVFFYNDKRLTDTSKTVLGHLAGMSHNGVTISLQTENPNALKNAKRTGVPPEKIAQVVEWASQQGLPVTTELIFGIPGETRESFANSLDVAIGRGFDSVLCNTLFIVDGIELNRRAERERLGIRTRYRSVRDNYGLVGDRFCAEIEEVVVATHSFDRDDFLDVRGISMLFYAVFNMSFHYWIVSHLKHLGVSITDLMRRTLAANGASPARRAFAADFKKAAEDELHDTPDGLWSSLEGAYRANGNDVLDAAQLNIRFGARLIYEDDDWIDDMFMEFARQTFPDDDAQQAACRAMIELYRRERIDLDTMAEPEPLEVAWDVLAWRRDKFRKPLADYRLDRPRRIRFSFKDSFLRKYETFRQDLAADVGPGFHVNLLNNIHPRSELLFRLDYA